MVFNYDLKMPIHIIHYNNTGNDYLHLRAWGFMS